MTKAAIVVGASGGIGGAVLERFQKEASVDRIFAISRTKIDPIDSRLETFQAGGDESQFAQVVKEIASYCASEHVVSLRIVIAIGLLHDGALQPEKRIESIEAERAAKVFYVNVILPMLWLKALTKMFSKEMDVRVAVLSARVGSIGDNRTGGWYSYRASKAALNMMLQTLAIEYARRFPKTKLLAFHPGTTSTSLSKPFQASVPANKLFSPEFVAKQLIPIMEELPFDGALSFLDWQGKAIPW